ncbi:MerR family transcriptional regulator [Eubacterium barkeri]|uniref:DNA-binding transcriptional regulator, MerR family n=1 Tax=Eubacterium barkeri TaxID=1528 RepID=A0A1H3AJ99_EUBBA|nr:MerR family transcriptional regulator [Eubacterium barkeri]SDX29787.1 DNA-binding transcriptional regulator, MerR family [Eubacterium barkeri]
MKEKYMFSIGEAAKALGITRRIILNYEDRGLLNADVRSDNGRVKGNRYYSMDTLTRIRTIRTMQNLGLSLDEILQYYDDGADLRPMIARLEKMRDELSLSIEKLKARVKDEGSNAIGLMTIPGQTVYCKTYEACTMAMRMTHLREIIHDAMTLYGSDTTKRMYFISYPLESPDTITYCVAILPGSVGEGVRVLPEVKALGMYYHGDYTSIPEVRDRLVAHARKNGIKLSGVCRHIYLEGPPQHQDPSRYITEVVLPLG